MARKEKTSTKLPKRLAGVKIPKNVREGLVKLARNPMVADLLAAGLVALAATVRDGAKAEPAKDDAAPAPAPKPAAKPRAAAAKPAAAKKPAAQKAAAPKPAATGKPKAPAKKPVAEGAAARKPTVRTTSRTKH